MQTFFITLGGLAVHHLFAWYSLLYLGTIFLGNIGIFLGFWLALSGEWHLNIFGFLGIVMAGYMTGDVIWYSLGRTLRETWLGTFIKDHLPFHEALEGHLARNGMRWVFASKFLYALGFPILFLSGWSGMNFKTVLKTSSFAALLSFPVIAVLTYGLFTGFTLLDAITKLQHLEKLFLAGFLFFILVNIGITRLIKRRLNA